VYRDLKIFRHLVQAVGVEVVDKVRDEVLVDYLKDVADDECDGAGS
jgi:hypothetical protein